MNFVSIYGTICFVFDFVDPLRTDNILIRWTRNNFPSLVLMKGLQFVIHGLDPMRMPKSLSESKWLLLLK